jgi:CubicO group peptidase (beta-lactamase class C family)
MVILYTLLALVSAVTSSQIPFQSSTNDQLLTPEITSWIDSILKEWNSPGLSVAVIRKKDSSDDEWKIEFSSHGIANSKGDAMTPDHQFAIASNSKLFTAISTGMLIHNETLWERKDESERLTWDSKVKDWIEEWELEDKEATEKTTLRDMFSHRTGLPRHDHSGMPREGGVREMVRR